MTILYTQRDGTQDRRPTYPAPTAPTEIFGATDPGEDVRAVVTVQVAMTRDMLATALDLAAGNCEEHPDSWSVPYIRESVELQLTYENFVELERTAQSLAEWEEIDESIKPYMQSIYRAVDRAYPVQGR
ncbi:hypothetical protein [Streptomyces sp. NBC_00096]|uniref:hypothetical protein n=1 Tax=Streptomyces sp. NBC_00096 TaxID=2975650 RepID=UPI0032533451